MKNNNSVIVLASLKVKNEFCDDFMEKAHIHDGEIHIDRYKYSLLLRRGLQGGGFFHHEKRDNSHRRGCRAAWPKNTA